MQIQGLTGEGIETAGPSMGPIISKCVRAMFASNVMIRIQMSWLSVIPKLDMGDFAVVLVSVSLSSRATC